MPNHNKEGRQQADHNDWSSRAKLNSGVSSTGIELRYYMSAEFTELTSKQRAEVSEYNATKYGGKWKGKGKGKGKPFDKNRSQNDGGSPSEKKIKSMISAAFADQTNDNSKTTAIAKTLKTLVTPFTRKNPGNATVGAAAAEEEDTQHKTQLLSLDHSNLSWEEPRR